MAPTVPVFYLKTFSFSLFLTDYDEENCRMKMTMMITIVTIYLQFSTLFLFPLASRNFSDRRLY